MSVMLIQIPFLQGDHALWSATRISCLRFSCCTAPTNWAQFSEHLGNSLWSVKKVNIVPGHHDHPVLKLFPQDVRARRLRPGELHAVRNGALLALRVEQPSPLRHRERRHGKPGRAGAGFYEIECILE